MDQTKPNVFARMANYFKDVKAEMKKVVWPTFDKIKKNTITVLVYVLVVGVVICGLDLLFTWLMQLFITR